MPWRPGLMRSFLKWRHRWHLNLNWVVVVFLCIEIEPGFSSSHMGFLFAWSKKHMQIIILHTRIRIACVLLKVVAICIYPTNYPSERLARQVTTIYQYLYNLWSQLRTWVQQRVRWEWWPCLRSSTSCHRMGFHCFHTGKRWRWASTTAGSSHLENHLR